MFELLMNAGGLTIALALLLYYSIKSYKFSESERTGLKLELSNLQREFHTFKNEIISNLINTINKNSDSLQHLTEKIEQNFK